MRVLAKSSQLQQPHPSNDDDDPQSDGDGHQVAGVQEDGRAHFIPFPTAHIQLMNIVTSNVGIHI